MITIYCLRDAAGCMRYVGKTTQTLAARLTKHLSEARGTRRYHRLVWLRSLQTPPAIEVLEWCLPMHWEERERYWVALACDYGCDLVNGTPGGDGGAGRKNSPETRAKLSAINLGRKRSPEACARNAAARRGKKLSAETRAKMSASHRNTSVATRARRVAASQKASPTQANTSGFKGVSCLKRVQKWRAYLSVSKKLRHLGCFSTAEEAARARDAAVIQYCPAEAFLNFPPKGII